MYCGTFSNLLADSYTRSCFRVISGALIGNGSYYIGKNYGTVSLDWEQQALEIQIHNTSGNTVLSTGPRSWKDLPASDPWTEEQIQFIHSCMNGHLWPLLKTASVALVVAFVMIRLTPKR